MKAENLLFILSDEHARPMLGCETGGYIKTPRLDALAQGGTLFENAYCNSPICVPARASLATGLIADYAHKCRKNMPANQVSWLGQRAAYHPISKNRRSTKRAYQ